jgi:large subunit ribosomal protein L2
MGKNLLQQRRGKGSLRFKAPNHNFVGEAGYADIAAKEAKGVVTDIVHCPAHSAPLLEVSFNNGEKVFMIAAQEKKVGNEIFTGQNAAVESGNVMALKDIPDGTEIFNVESNAGDGGKFARSGGNCARVLSKTEKEITVMLPSKKQRKFSPNCRATIGRVAGAGRLDKPLLKAGTAFFKTTARNRFWPNVCGQSMNAVAHPHGGKRSSKKNYSLISSRDAPPGAKVGKISPRRTGKKR